jgi:hypothetical protein
VSHFSYAQRLAAAGGRDINDDPYDPILLDESGLTRRAGTPSFLAPEVISEHVNESASLFSSTSQSPSSESSVLTATTIPTTSQSTTPTPTTGTSAPTDRPQITKSIDIWALGVTLYCLLFGGTPFHAAQSLTTTGSEFSLYNAICNDDWEVPQTMGYDRIPTGGRHPNPSLEGASVINLLDRFLQKDYHVRITLDEVKVCLFLALISVLIWIALPAESSSHLHFLFLLFYFLVNTVTYHSVYNPQRHPWFLKGLDDPTYWIFVTSPKASPIDVSVHETSDAMSAVHFRWRWGGKLVQQVSSLLRGVRPLTRQELHPTRGAQRQLQYRQVGVNSIPESRRSGKTAASVNLQGTEAGVLFPSNGDSKKDKGKAKATQQNQQQQHSPKTLKRPNSKGGSKSLRSKSIERWPQALRGTYASTDELQGSNPKARRGSDTKIWTGEMDGGRSRGASGSSTSSPITPNAPNHAVNGRPGTVEKRARFASIFQGWRPNKYAAAATSTTRHHVVVASPTEYAQLQSSEPRQFVVGSSSRIVMPSPTTPNTRRSEEALRYYGQSASMGTCFGSTGPPLAFDEDDPENAGALLTAARRASSWGQGDTELTELVSVQSVGQDLNEQEMNVGAGGIAREGISVPAVGGLPSVVAASTSASEAVAKAIVNSRRLSMTPVAASGSGSGASALGGAAAGGGLDMFFREEDIQRYGRPVFDDTSTVGSVDRDGDEDPEWRRGSELEDDFYDDDDPPDDDDASRNFSDDEEEDEEEESGVTFSPRKHGLTNH